MDQEQRREGLGAVVITNIGTGPGVGAPRQRLIFFSLPIAVVRSRGLRIVLVEGVDYRIEPTEGDWANTKFIRPITMNDGDHMETMLVKRWIPVEKPGRPIHGEPITGPAVDLPPLKGDEPSVEGHTEPAATPLERRKRREKLLDHVEKWAAVNHIGCGCTYDALRLALNTGRAGAVNAVARVAAEAVDDPKIGDDICLGAALAIELGELYGMALHRDIELLHERVDLEKKKRLNLQMQVEQLRAQAREGSKTERVKYVAALDPYSSDHWWVR
jgi:hypothetical protein